VTIETSINGFKLLICNSGPYSVVTKPKTCHTTLSRRITSHQVAKCCNSLASNIRAKIGGYITITVTVTTKTIHVAHTVTVVNMLLHMKQ